MPGTNSKKARHDIPRAKLANNQGIIMKNDMVISKKVTFSKDYC
jgi:hypothetical protein